MATAGGEASGCPSASLSGVQVLDMLGTPAQRRRTMGARYNIDLEVDGLVWLPLVEWGCSMHYPNATEGERQVLVSAMCHAFAENTTAQYLSSFRAFAEFCCEHDPELVCLPADKQSVHLFLAAQVSSGSVAAGTLAGMVSAINAVHNLCALPPPVHDDSQHRLLMAGLQRIIRPLQQLDERKPILCSMIVQALTQLVPLDHAPPATAITEHLPIVAVVLGMLTGLRGSALAALRLQDLTVSTHAIVIKAEVLKRRLQPRMFADWSIPLHLDSNAPLVAGGDVWKRIHRLLVMHLAFRATVAGSCPLLAPVSSQHQVSESTIDRYVASFVQKFGNDIRPVGFSSHSLRIGSASAMIAAGVNRNVIRIWFRWKSEGMIDTYARVVACDAAVKTLFGWMLHCGHSFTLYQ